MEVVVWWKGRGGTDNFLFYFLYTHNASVVGKQSDNGRTWSK